MRRVVEGRIGRSGDYSQEDLRIMNNDGSAYDSNSKTGFSLLGGFEGRKVRVTVEDVEDPVIAVQRCIYPNGVQFDVLLMDSKRQIVVIKPVWRNWDKKEDPPRVRNVVERLAKFLGLKTVRLEDIFMDHVVLADDYKYFMDVDYVEKEGI